MIFIADTFLGWSIIKRLGLSCGRDLVSSYKCSPASWVTSYFYRRGRSKSEEEYYQDRNLYKLLEAIEPQSIEIFTGRKGENALCLELESRKDLVKLSTSWIAPKQYIISIYFVSNEGEQKLLRAYTIRPGYLPSRLAIELISKYICPTLEQITKLKPHLFLSCSLVRNKDIIGPKISILNDVFQTAIRGLCKLTEKLIFKERWRSSLAIDGEAVELSLSNGVSFLADPFIYNGINGITIYAESFYKKISRGVISRYVMHQNSPVHDADFFAKKHMSFPRVHKRQNGALLSTAEESESNRFNIYHGDLFDPDAIPELIFEKIKYYDPVLFEVNEQLYLFITIDRPGCYLANELHLYYMDSATRKWCAHDASPVDISGLSSRMAGGVIKIGNDYFRPYQAVDPTYYGSHVGLKKIINISPFEYEEQDAGQLNPQGRSRFHTYNVDNHLSVYDYV